MPGRLELESGTPRVCWDFVSVFGIRNQHQSSQTFLSGVGSGGCGREVTTGRHDSLPAPCLRLHTVLVGLTPLQHLVLGKPLLRLLISSLEHWEAAGSSKVPWAQAHRLCGREEELLHPLGGEKWSHGGPMA